MTGALRQRHGTCEDTLIRVLVGRSEVDLKKIISEFKLMYGKTLQQCILVRLSIFFALLVYATDTTALIRPLPLDLSPNTRFCVFPQRGRLSQYLREQRGVLFSP